MMRRERLLRDPEFVGLRILASNGSREGHQLDDFLDKNRIPHRVIDVESEAGRSLSQRLNINRRDLPVFIDGNGRPLRRPSIREVAQVAGLIRPLVEQGETEIFCDLAIIGAGPAGLSAALNAASEGLKTIVLESYAPGGQAGSSSLIENFFGFPTGISGGDLTNHALIQAFRFGAKFSTPSQALSLGFTEGEYGAELYTEGSPAALRAKCVLIATGAEYRRIEAEGLGDFEGTGVYYAATAMEARLVPGHNRRGRRGREFCRAGGDVSVGERGKSASGRPRRHAFQNHVELPFAPDRNTVKHRDSVLHGNSPDDRQRQTRSGRDRKYENQRAACCSCFCDFFHDRRSTPHQLAPARDCLGWRSGPKPNDTWSSGRRKSDQITKISILKFSSNSRRT